MKRYIKSKRGFDKGHKSKWSNASEKSTGITQAHGLILFNTTARAKDS